MSTIIVRPFEAPDAAAWGAMRARLWADADAEDLLSEARAFAGGAELVSPHAVFIAESDGVPAGFLELSVRAFADGCDSMPVPHVEGWYVEPGVRGRGVGRALMAAAERWSLDRGYTELGSDTETHNTGSQSAHAACGFEEMERLVKFRKRLGGAPVTGA